MTKTRLVLTLAVVGIYLDKVAFTRLRKFRQNSATLRLDQDEVQKPVQTEDELCDYPNFFEGNGLPMPLI